MRHPRTDKLSMPGNGQIMEESIMKKAHMILDFLILIALLAILILAIIGAAHLITQGRL